MQLTSPIVLSLLFSCCLGDVKTRKVTSSLRVFYGGQWGEWGGKEYCPTGYAEGFSLKVQQPRGALGDDTGANGIRLHCSDGSLITSSVGQDGDWSEEFSCRQGYLTSFTLRVSPPQGTGDDTAVNNIKFKCPDMTEIEGNGPAWGTYGEWSDTCTEGFICGLLTKVEIPKGLHKLDHTGLNNAIFFCCI